uniref:RNA polymerase, sigma 28 (Sigma F) factor n=1 Tax=Magnetococcus massalia (strain MO-1) TaxID=451514 RepID=A0A1S7LLH2_MAGMO|nr:RNA polymerase, sigma 28 (sigma F) factor [Candidatus Magnetococcus massalia]
MSIMNMHKPDLSKSQVTAEDWNSLTREQIILKFAPLVRYVAGRIAMKLPQSVDLDDLYQVGVLGLIDAVSKFDPERGIKFQTYAEFRIRGAILDELRAIDWVPRQLRQNATAIQEAYSNLEAKHGRPADDAEVAESLGLSITEFHEQLDQVRGISIISFEDIRPNTDDEEWDVLEVLADPSVEDPVETIGLMELREAMADAIDTLPEKERLVVTLYYFEELTMNEIGDVLGLTESRISQLHSKAALRMRARIKRFFNRKGDVE